MDNIMQKIARKKYVLESIMLQPKYIILNETVVQYLLEYYIKYNLVNDDFTKGIKPTELLGLEVISTDKELEDGFLIGV